MSSWSRRAGFAFDGAWRHDRQQAIRQGPRRYTPEDVAQALADAFSSPVVAVGRTPPERWETTFLAAGFSTAATDSFTGLTALANCDPWEVDGDTTRGTITLEDYINDLLTPGMTGRG